MKMRGKTLNLLTIVLVDKIWGSKDDWHFKTCIYVVMEIINGMCVKSY